MSTSTLNGNGHQEAVATAPPLRTAVFTPAQKEYLARFMAGVAQRAFVPFAAHTAGGANTSTPSTVSGR